MKNNKKDTNSGARKVLAWIPYILIPVLIISGVSLYARQQKKEKLEYYQVVQYFDDKKVTEYDLNMSSGALEFKLKGDNKELLIIPGANHTDLYDNFDKIPFDKIEAFYRENLK